MNPVEIAKELIKIDTRNPPGYTTKAVEFLESLFSSYNTKIYAKEEGKENLVVEISKGKPTVMLTSHLDTVPCDEKLLNPVVINGKLYGRGSCDAKGCVASICYSALNLRDVDVGLKLAFTCDEEVGGFKGLGFVFPREKADVVLIGEPTGSNCIGVLQAFVVSVDIYIKGESGHTASQEAEYGAIYRASEYIVNRVRAFRDLRGNFKEYKEFFEKMGYEFVIKSWHSVFNPAIIQGGIKRNVVAPNCVIKADIRFAPWISIDEIKNLLEDECVERIDVVGFLKSYGVKFDEVELSKDLKVLKILRDIIKNMGKTPKAVFSLGVGDTRHVRKYGVPAFYIGPGGEGLHSDNEFVYISELYDAAKVYTEFINALESF